MGFYPRTKWQFSIGSYGMSFIIIVIYGMSFIHYFIHYKWLLIILWDEFSPFLLQICPACNGDGIDPSSLCTSCRGKAADTTGPVVFENPVGLWMFLGNLGVLQVLLIYFFRDFCWLHGTNLGIAMCDTLVEPVRNQVFECSWRSHYMGVALQMGGFSSSTTRVMRCKWSSPRHRWVCLETGPAPETAPWLMAISSWGKLWCEASDLGVPTNSNGLVDGFQMFF